MKWLVSIQSPAHFLLLCPRTDNLSWFLLSAFALPIGLYSDLWFSILWIGWSIRDPCDQRIPLYLHLVHSLLACFVSLCLISGLPYDNFCWDEIPSFHHKSTVQTPLPVFFSMLPAPAYLRSCRYSVGASFRYPLVSPPVLPVSVYRISSWDVPLKIQGSDRDFCYILLWLPYQFLPLSPRPLPHDSFSTFLCWSDVRSTWIPCLDFLLITVIFSPISFPSLLLSLGIDDVSSLI